MSFLSDFLYYSSGTECPDDFLTWSGLSLIGALAGKKIWTQHGSAFTIDPKTYVVMVGTPGSGKSTAMDQVEKIFVKHFPSYLISESIQSREDILKKMSSPECIRTWKDQNGQIQEFRPFYCLVDEMENFISVDDKKMVGMLVGIYGRSSFGTGFKNDANPNQRIPNPYLSLLACTIPEWMMSSLRMSLFTGGLGRRLIIVHAKKIKDVPQPNLPDGHEACMQRMVSHLKQVEAAWGLVSWTPAARQWWDKWYCNKDRKAIDDPILIQFHETKHIQLLKVATQLCLTESPIKLVIDVAHMEMAEYLLTKLEKEIRRLTSGIGRNELAGIGAQLIEFIGRTGGMQTEVNVKKFFWRYVNDPEFIQIEQRYISQGELFKDVVHGPNGPRMFYFTPEGYETYKTLRAEVNAKKGAL